MSLPRFQDVYVDDGSPWCADLTEAMFVDDTVRIAWTLAGRFPPNKEIVYPDIVEVHELDANSGKCVLEYGCGGGADAMSFLRRKCEVFYADIVPENIVVAQERIRAAGLETRARSVLLRYSAPIPLHDCSVDVVLADGVIHHIPCPGPILREFLRVLRPGGVVYVMLHSEKLWAACLSDIEARVQKGVCKNEFEAFAMSVDYGAPYATAYTEDEGRQLLEQAGFVVEWARLWNDANFRTFKGRK